MAKLDRRPIDDTPREPGLEQRQPLLPERQGSDEDSELMSGQLADRIGRRAGFDLSGQGSQRVKYTRKKEARNDIVNLRLRPSIANALRDYAWSQDLSLADVIEGFVESQILAKKAE
jgi:hypothetical protein